MAQLLENCTFIFWKSVRKLISKYITNIFHELTGFLTLDMAPPMNFTTLPFASMDKVDNPLCGLSEGSEVHFFLKGPTPPAVTSRIDLVTINLGDRFKVVLGESHADLYRLLNEGETKLIHQVTQIPKTFIQLGKRPKNHYPLLYIVTKPSVNS